MKSRLRGSSGWEAGTRGADEEVGERVPASRGVDVLGRRHVGFPVMDCVVVSGIVSEGDRQTIPLFIYLRGYVSLADAENVTDMEVGCGGGGWGEGRG